MNNEPNKPVELTEKELEGIAGGGAIVFLPTATGKEDEWEVKRVAVESGGGGSFVLVSPGDTQFAKIS